MAHNVFVTTNHVIITHRFAVSCDTDINGVLHCQLIQTCAWCGSLRVDCRLYAPKI